MCEKGTGEGRDSGTCLPRGELVPRGVRSLVERLVLGKDVVSSKEGTEV